MTEATDKMIVEYERPAGWSELRHTKLAGPDLPVEVTAQSTTIGVWNTTERINENGRPEGWMAYSLTIGGRANPLDLTPDEREYVARLLEHAATDFRSGHALRPSDDRG